MVGMREPRSDSTGLIVAIVVVLVVLCCVAIIVVAVKKYRDEVAADKEVAKAMEAKTESLQTSPVSIGRTEDESSEFVTPSSGFGSSSMSMPYDAVPKFVDESSGSLQSSPCKNCFLSYFSFFFFHYILPIY